MQLVFATIGAGSFLALWGFGWPTIPLAAPRSLSCMSLQAQRQWEELRCSYSLLPQGQVL